ncbi:MAG: glutamine cyclotransferase [Flavobacteriales bacterium]|nr:MAG: glutamine cyclotransferase [Flavobacteriales bacterium]
MIKIYKIYLVLAISLAIGSCGNRYQLILTSPEKLTVGEKLSASVQEKNQKPIDSIWYYLDGKRFSNPDNIDVSGLKLGRHAIVAVVFFNGKQKKLTNTLTVFPKQRPEIYTYEVINTYPHNDKAFTQGLEFYNGFIYESTGQYKESSLRKVELKTGRVLQKKDLEDNIFGEGMTIFNNKVYLLTWQNGFGYIFSLQNFEQENTFSYGQSKEGWGLTHNNTHLLKSDGTERIWTLSPETGEELSYIEVYTIDRKVDKLNELEFINGKIYANRWQANSIVIINPKNGLVEGIANLKGLQKLAGQTGDDNVLNGIAYDAENDRLFVTGKDWNKLFEIKLVKG